MATDLQTTGSRSVTQSPEQALPERLRGALEKIQSVKDLPPCGPNTRAMIAASIPKYERASAGSSIHEVERLLTAMASAWPSSKISDAEANARLELFGPALADIPLDILKSALQDAVRTCTFFPSVKEIRDLAAPLKSRRAWELMALKYWAQKSDHPSPNPT